MSKVIKLPGKVDQTASYMKKYIAPFFLAFSGAILGVLVYNIFFPQKAIEQIQRTNDTKYVYYEQPSIERGLKIKPWVKTSLAPGSKVVTDYLEKAGLNKYLDELGFNLVGYGCTTCIGNSGPLPDNIVIKFIILIICKDATIFMIYNVLIVFFVQVSCF